MPDQEVPIYKPPKPVDRDTLNSSICLRQYKKPLIQIRKKQQLPKTPNLYGAHAYM